MSSKSLRRQKPAQALPIEALESRCLLSPLGKGGHQNVSAEVSEARAVPRNGFPIQGLVGTWSVTYAWSDSRDTTVTGTMEFAAGDNEKSYVAHFVAPGVFDCVLKGSAKFGQPTGLSGKAVDESSGLKVKFKTHLNSFFNFEGTVKAGKNKGTIVGTAVDTDPF